MARSFLHSRKRIHSTHSFDSAVFKQNTDKRDTQAFVEEPEISIIAISSSSIQDQAALIGDRADCIQELSAPLKTDNNIPITDKLKFFNGDKPAAQFERGTQIGGHYPCGACGAHIPRFNDFAHCVQCKWRSLEELQQLVIQGRSYSRTVHMYMYPAQQVLESGLFIGHVDVHLHVHKHNYTHHT